MPSGKAGSAGGTRHWEKLCYFARMRAALSFLQSTRIGYLVTITPPEEEEGEDGDKGDAAGLTVSFVFPLRYPLPCPPPPPPFRGGEASRRKGGPQNIWRSIAWGPGSRMWLDRNQRPHPLEARAWSVSRSP